MSVTNIDYAASRKSTSMRIIQPLPSGQAVHTIQEEESTRSPPNNLKKINSRQFIQLPLPLQTISSVDIKEMGKKNQLIDPISSTISTGTSNLVSDSRHIHLPHIASSSSKQIEQFQNVNPSNAGHIFTPYSGNDSYNYNGMSATGDVVNKSMKIQRINLLNSKQSDSPDNCSLSEESFVEVLTKNVRNRSKRLYKHSLSKNRSRMDIKALQDTIITPAKIEKDIHVQNDVENGKISANNTFLRKFSEALLQKENGLEEEDSLEGSQHRVKKLFQKLGGRRNQALKQEFSLETQDYLQDIVLNSVEVPNESQINATIILANEAKNSKVKKVFSLSEKYQKLFKAFETNVKEKTKREKQLEELNHQLSTDLSNLEFQLYDKELQSKKDQETINRLKNKVGKLESLYEQEKHSKEILIRGTEFSEPDLPRVVIEDEDGSNVRDSNTIFGSDKESGVSVKRQNKVDDVVNSIVSDSATELSMPNQTEEAYVRFVDGFSHRLQAYEAEKILSQQQLAELKSLIREKDEVMSNHIKRLEEALKVKDQQINLEREKFRKVLYNRLTRGSSQKFELVSVKNNEKQELRSARKEDQKNSRKRSFADHRKQQLMKRRKSSVSSKSSSQSEDYNSLSTYSFPGKRSLSVQNLFPHKSIQSTIVTNSNPGRLFQIEIPKEIDRDDVEKKRSLIEEQGKLLQSDYTKLVKELDVINRRISVYDKNSTVKSARSVEVTGPTGRVVIVFTDIQGSTNLWESSIDDMSKSIEIHNDIVRQILQETNGFEVKTEGDAFMCAFVSVFNAVDFAMQCQMKFLEAEWPEGLYKLPEGKIEIDENGVIVFKGIRVRMGMHVGEPIIMKDPITNREDYFGPVVNKAARVEGCAHGGEICISNDVWLDIKSIMESDTKRKKWIFPPVIRKTATVTLKGIKGNETVRSILPEPLKNRIFPTENQLESLESVEDAFNTIKNLKEKVEILHDREKTMRKDIKYNDYKKQLLEKEEIIQYLSRELLELHEQKETKMKDMKRSKRSTEYEVKKNNYMKEKEAKRKYKVSQTSIKQMNRQLQQITRQRDTYQKKSKELQLAMIHANDTLSDLRLEIKRLRSELQAQQKKNAFHKVRSNVSIRESEEHLPKIVKPKKSNEGSKQSVSHSGGLQVGKKEKVETPRYMKQLTRRPKSDVGGYVNPLWQTRSHSSPQTDEETEIVPKDQNRGNLLQKALTAQFSIEQGLSN